MPGQNYRPLENKERLQAAEEAALMLDQTISHVKTVFNLLDNEPLNRPIANEWKQVETELTAILHWMNCLAR